MPVTAAPDAASAVMAWLPSPVRPLTGERVQVAPLAEVQTAAAMVPPDEPNRAAAVNRERKREVSRGVNPGVNPVAIVVIVRRWNVRYHKRQALK